VRLPCWKKAFIDKSEMIFSKDKMEKVDESKEKELYAKICELQV
jgi:hypothetical protein